MTNDYINGLQAALTRVPDTCTCGDYYSQNSHNADCSRFIRVAIANLILRATSQLVEECEVLEVVDT